jgi:hypothetical protein
VESKKSDENSARL